MKILLTSDLRGTRMPHGAFRGHSQSATTSVRSLEISWTTSSWKSRSRDSCEDTNTQKSTGLDKRTPFCEGEANREATARGTETSSWGSRESRHHPFGYGRLLHQHSPEDDRAGRTRFCRLWLYQRTSHELGPDLQMALLNDGVRRIPGCPVGARCSTAPFPCHGGGSKDWHLNRTFHPLAVAARPCRRPPRCFLHGRDRQCQRS